jgi:hypothetical protein
MVDVLRVGDEVMVDLPFLSFKKAINRFAVIPRVSVRFFPTVFGGPFR